MALGLGIWLGIGVGAASRRAWNPTALFQTGENGVWYDPSDITTMFSDTAGTTQITSGGAIARINDKTTNGLNATKDPVSQRPLYVVASNGDKLIQNDEIDDALIVTLPDMGMAATVAYVTQSEVFYLENQTIGTGAYTLPATDILGMVVIDRALTTIEKIKLIIYLASKAQGVNYGATLSAIQTACLNAVDVFVYDTSKDSDSGAAMAAAGWGAQLLIVAKATSAVIYDATDPNLATSTTLDFTGYTVTSCAALSGILVVGTTTGVASFNLANGDTTVALDYTTTTAPAIVNNSVNDVLLEVLAGAPSDGTSGLPVPTRYIGTAGGLSVIDDAGPVYDSAKTTSCTNLTLDQDGKLRASFSDGVSVVYDQTVIAADGFTGTNLTTTASPYLMGTATSSAYDALGSSSGLTLLMANNAGSCRIGHNYNTGLMPGNIKGAFLSDTDTASPVDATLLSEDFTSGVGTGSITIGNGTFTASGGYGVVARDVAASGYTSATFAISTTIGQTYYASGELTATDGTPAVIAKSDSATTINSNRINIYGGSSGTSTLGSGVATFVATATTTYIHMFLVNSGSPGIVTCSFDNISVKLADADRSVNNNVLIFNGTITREAVASGSESVWYTFDTDCTLDLGSDITSSGSITWWEKIGGNPVFSVLNFDGSNSYVNGVVGAPVTTGVEVVGTVLTIKAGATLRSVRPSGTPVSAAQVAQIYAYELPLFQENAACTLYGTSDAVTAIAHDPDTGLLHVGTSSGRSVFGGLQRKSNTTTSVATAISAAGGLVASK